ncbi:FadR/GntR family transcriptional regulator [Janthinobacterium sp.]|uniref:FadR/GntR family transcriptional regulator n=1 Tax=Janthinobacterium sp. TaxID=1871054 RepID=UPI00259094C8|nr:FadR/GntR family transcriptional regulator [Janthinobacterium sp.]
MQTRGRVETVMRRLETALLDGSLPAGAQLPAERLLAQQYGVSRNTVREAVQRLAARGLVRSRSGAGVFVTDQLRTEFRRVLEGATAYFAAQRASTGERAQIMALLAELEQARAHDDKHGEAQADARLHEVIAQASHNTMFLHLHTSIIGMLREHITINGTGLRQQDDATSLQLLSQHRTLCEAICASQPEEARTAMQSHIDFVRTRVTSDAD